MLIILNVNVFLQRFEKFVRFDLLHYSMEGREYERWKVNTQISFFYFSYFTKPTSISQMPLCITRKFHFYFTKPFI